MWSYDQMMEFLFHKMDVWDRQFVNCRWDELCDKNLSMKSYFDSHKILLLSSALMIVKGFCVKTWLENDDVKESIDGCSQRDPHEDAWCVCKISIVIHELTTYAVLTFAISVSEFQVIYNSWNISVYESRLGMCHLKREIFRGSYCDQDDDRLCDTDLTIHVNVADKVNCRLRQWNRTVKDHLMDGEGSSDLDLS